MSQQHRTRKNKTLEFSFNRQSDTDSPRPKLPFNAVLPDAIREERTRTTQGSEKSKMQLLKQFKDLENDLFDRENELKRLTALIRKLESDGDWAKKALSDEKQKYKAMQKQLKVLGDVSVESYKFVKELMGCCFGIVRSALISLV